MIAAVVPLKRLSEAKSRLSPRLSATERTSLALELLQGVIGALRASGSIKRIAVITPEIRLPIQSGIELLPDAGDLNSSLAAGIRWAGRLGADSLLILPADLPLVTPNDVRALIEAAGRTPGIALAATHDGGTGALLLTPPGVITPAFGRDSFRRHLTLAAEAGLAAQVISRPAFESDLDTLDDLSLLRR